jgi:CRISPR/Cas system-associated protein Csm6
VAGAGGGQRHEEGKEGGEADLRSGDGGYKPKSTFAVTAAYVAGAHGVVYVHETIKDVVEPPYSPSSWRKPSPTSPGERQTNTT